MIAGLLLDVSIFAIFVASAATLLFTIKVATLFDRFLKDEQKARAKIIEEPRRETDPRRKDMSDLKQDIGALKKEIKELERVVNALTTEFAKVGDSMQRVWGRLEGLGSKSSGLDLEIARLKNELYAAEQTAREIREKRQHDELLINEMAKEVDMARAEAGQAREAVARSREEADQAQIEAARTEEERSGLERALAEERRANASERVEASADAISDALANAVNRVGPPNSSPEINVARGIVEGEGGRIRQALEAAVRGDAEGVAPLVEASLFDPFSFPSVIWPGAIAAKRSLESAREAALELICAAGFRVDRPRITVDLYNPDFHDLRDSIPAPTPDLKGRIAEVRRIGLLYQGRAIRPARVVQYVISHPTMPNSPTPALPVSAPGCPGSQEIGPPDAVPGSVDAVQSIPDDDPAELLRRKRKLED